MGAGATLVHEGVDVSALLTHPGRPTGFYLKGFGTYGTSMHYYRERSAASTLDRVPPGAHDGVGHVHLTGITPALSAECSGLVRRELQETGGRSTSFDVNYRAALWSPETAAPVLRELARMATVAFVGLDEARRLWGCPDAEAVRELLPEPEEVVVKDGPRDATVLTATGSVSTPALPVTVVEPVGAGDAFAAGYLATRLRGDGLEPALRTGHTLAATVIRSYSDHGAPMDPAALAAVVAGSGWPDATE
ncbi:MAG: sugar kinase [Actinomycetes bacterium]